ncbi:MAG: SdpI family protein [Thermoanaerobaculia bacterium]
MVVPIPYVHLSMGIVTILVSLPLILGMVPRNRLYGIRTKRAFVSEENWYAINAYGGKLFLLFGILLTAFGYFGRADAPSPTSAWAPVYMAVPLLAIFPLLFLINRFSRRFPER